MSDETSIVQYFQYYIREDDRSKPLHSFMLCIVNVCKEPKHQKI